MTTNVAIHQPSAPRPIRIRRLRRPRAGMCLVLTGAALFSIVAAAPSRATEFAHDVCTAGTAEHVTCGEALYLLGYP